MSEPRTKYFVGGALDNPPMPVERPSDRLSAEQINRAVIYLQSEYRLQHLGALPWSVAVKWVHAVVDEALK